jgi:hypothetical protein
VAARRSRRSLLTMSATCAMQRTSRCDPIQVNQWKRQLLDGASELFTGGKKTKDKEDSQAKENELVQPYCFAEALRLRTASDGPGVAQKNLSCPDARQLRQLVDHEHPDLSVKVTRVHDVATHAEFLPGGPDQAKLFTGTEPSA